MSASGRKQTSEAVYYSAPIPRSKASLTLMGLVFDRIHFPNVFLPSNGFDAEAVHREAERLEVLPHIDFERAVLIGMLRALPHLTHLNEFCVFGGTEEQIFGGDLKDAIALRSDIDRALFGDYPEGWTPIYGSGLHKPLPGGSHIDYPEPLNYLATALVYSARTAIPIANDAPEVPVVPLVQEKVSANLLASILALKCVEFALPAMPPLSPAAIVDLRAELKPQLRAFRASIARLVVTLNGFLQNDDTWDDIDRKANILVKTEIAAALSDLQTALKKPKVVTFENALTAAGLVVPVLTTAAASVPFAVAAALAGIGALGVKIRRDQNEPQRSGLYYSLRAREATRS